MRTTKKASSKRPYKDYHSSDYGVEDDEEDYGREELDEDIDDFNEDDPNNQDYERQNRGRPDSADSDYLSGEDGKGRGRPSKRAGGRANEDRLQ